jgi:predicted PurR-regulated permease PerM
MLLENIPLIYENYISSNNLLDKIMSYLFSFFSSFISNFSYFLINGVLIIPLMFYMYYKKRKKNGLIF